MPLSMCTWCMRFRATTLRTWSSARSGKQLVGDVCDHCYVGTAHPDGCRTCKRRAEKQIGQVLERNGAHEMTPADVPLLLEAYRESRNKRASNG
jgi:hypothetical protein